MSRRVLVLALLCAACGPDDDRRVWPGWYVQVDDGDPWQSVQAANLVITAVAHQGSAVLHLNAWQLFSEFDDWVIWLVAPTRFEDGDHYAGFSLIEVTDPCLARTTLTHELTHLLQELAFGDVDYLHEDDRFWGAAGVEQRATALALDVLCPGEGAPP